MFEMTIEFIQHCPFQCSRKCTQIWGFGMKINHLATLGLVTYQKKTQQHLGKRPSDDPILFSVKQL
jgi:hypothetical protein